MKLWPAINAQDELPVNAEETYSARQQIGEYGPEGKQCSTEDFRKDYCGVRLSFPKKH